MTYEQERSREVAMELNILDQNAKITPGWKSDIERLAERVHLHYPHATHMKVILTRHPHYTKGSDIAEILVELTLTPDQTVTAHTFEPTFGDAIQSGFALLDAEMRRADGILHAEKDQLASRPRHTPLFPSI